MRKLCNTEKHTVLQTLHFMIPVEPTNYNPQQLKKLTM